RRRFKVFLRHLNHVADFVDQQADGAVIRLHDHVHGKQIGGTVPEPQPASQLDSHDNLAAQIDEPAHHRRRQWHPRHGPKADDLLDFQHVDAEIVAIEKERAVLMLAGHGCHAGLGCSNNSGSKVRMIFSMSMNSVTCPCSTAVYSTPARLARARVTIASSTMS